MSERFKGILCFFMAVMAIGLIFSQVTTNYHSFSGFQLDQHETEQQDRIQSGEDLYQGHLIEVRSLVFRQLLKQVQKDFKVDSILTFYLPFQNRFLISGRLPNRPIYLQNHILRV